MQELNDLLSTWLNYLGPGNYLRAAVALVAFLLLAMLSDLLVAVILRRSMRRWMDRSVEPLVGAARQPIFFSIVFIGLLFCLDILDLSERAERLSIAALSTLLIIVWFVFGIRLIRITLEALARRHPVPSFAQPTTATLMRNAVVVILGLASTYAVLLAWDVNVTGLVASAGILGLALSLAAQDTLGNLIAGIAILTDKPYRIGDYIVLDTGERGAVTHIGLRSTRLLTRDDVEVSIPNGVMGRAKIVNESGSPNHKYRLRTPITVAYGSDIDEVMTLMLAVAAGHAQVCATPEPRMRLRRFGDSGLEFEMLCWIEQPAMRGLVQHELNCTLYREFAERGIRMPLPQRELHFTAMPLAASQLPGDN